MNNIRKYIDLVEGTTYFDYHVTSRLGTSRVGSVEGARRCAGIHAVRLGEFDKNYEAIRNYEPQPFVEIGSVSITQIPVTDDGTLTEGVSTFTMWHGGRSLHTDYNEMRSNPRGRWEHGPGIYLTNRLETARKYAKGGGKIYKVLCRIGTDISDVTITLNDAMPFVDRYVVKRKRAQFIEDLERSESRHSGRIPIETVVNLSLNDNAISSPDTMALRKFLIQHGVDYIRVNGYGGRGSENLVVIVNPDIIERVTIMTPKDIDAQINNDVEM